MGIGDVSITEISQPEALLSFIMENDISIVMTDKEAEMLLGYMEGHDYVVGFAEGRLFRGDMDDVPGEIVWDDFSVDDLIDAVCEWNYELILDADAHRNDPKDFKDYSEYQDKYDSLKADEKRLDRLFEKTCYAKEIDEMAAALVESFISHLSSRDDLEKAAVTVAEGIKDYSTGKRGR